jgi:VanZ family protein
MPARRPAVIVAALATVYLLVMFLGTHLPLRGVSSSALGADKVVHATMYAGLAVLILAAASFFRPVNLGTAVVVLGVIAAYAAVDEWSQSFVPTRTADVWDWAADVVGSLVGAAGFLAARSLLRRRRAAQV